MNMVFDFLKIFKSLSNIYPKIGFNDNGIIIIPIAN